MPDARPIWLTREQRDSLCANYGPDIGGAREWLWDAWDAAPADSEMAVLDALEAIGVHVIGSTTAVLRALGYPE